MGFTAFFELYKMYMFIMKINNKIDEFNDFCFKYKPHIISLNETKLNDFRADYILQINNYNTIYKSRNSMRNGAGGVALLIREDIKYSECKLFEDLDLEICAINITMNKKEVCVFSYYNPPQKELCEKVFQILKETKTDFILLGDINAKMTSWKTGTNNTNGEILNDIILSYDCLIVNNKEPTHFSFNGNSESLLDFCIISTNIHDQFDSFEVLKKDDMTSDHVPILIKFNKNVNEQVIGSCDVNTRKYYNLNKADWLKFKDYLPKTLPTDIDKNINKINRYIIDSIIDSADKSIPVYKLNKYNNRKLPKYILDG
jgi:exonuclease III